MIIFNISIASLSQFSNGSVELTSILSITNISSNLNETRIQCSEFSSMVDNSTPE